MPWTSGHGILEAFTPLCDSGISTVLSPNCVSNNVWFYCILCVSFWNMAYLSLEPLILM